MKTTVVGALLLLSLICTVEAIPSPSCEGLCELAKNDCVDLRCVHNTIPCLYDCYDENAQCKARCPGKK